MSHHEGSPEKRYVHLHRLIEQGLADDPVWGELSSVCLRLGYISESVKAASNITSPTDRRRAEALLEAYGASTEQQSPEGSDEERDPTAAKRAPSWRRGRSLSDLNFKEEVSDAFSFLFFEHIPYIVMSLTLLFPLSLSIGGTLTSGSDIWIFPAMALIPVLAIAIVVAAVAQQILMDAAQGRTDVPQVSDAPMLARRGAFLIRDMVIGFAGMLLPGLLACTFLGTIGLPILLVGAALFPMAITLCQTRKDMRGFDPKVVFPTAWGAGTPGLCTIGLVWALFLPAVAAMSLTEGSEMFLRMAIVGPLSIAPLVVSARLIGRVLYLNHETLKAYVWTEPQAIDEDKQSVKSYKAAIRESQRTAAVQGSGRQAAIRESQRTASPRDSQRTRSPRDSQRAPSPRDSQRTRSPRDSQRAPSPRDSQRAPSPRESQRAPSPRDSQRTRSPRDSQRAPSPRDSQRTRSPRDSQRAPSPRDSQRTRSPRDSQRRPAVQGGSRPDPRQTRRPDPARARQRDLDSAADAHSKMARRRAAPSTPDLDRQDAAPKRPWRTTGNQQPAPGASSGPKRRPAENPDSGSVEAFTEMPGFVVVRGEERKSAGAASRRPDPS